MAKEVSKEMAKDARAADPVEGRAADAAEKRAGAEQALVPKKERKAVREPVYSADELAASAGTVFGTRPECVLSALRVAGKEKCTVPAAKEIVEKFLKKEVK